LPEKFVVFEKCFCGKSSNRMFPQASLSSMVTARRSIKPIALRVLLAFLIAHYLFGLFALSSTACSAQMSQAKPILTSIPPKVIPNYDNLERIDDLFELPDEWSYVPDKPKLPGKFKRDMNIALPSHTNSIGFAGADSNIGVFLQDSGY